jgi:hypothetical protein
MTEPSGVPLEREPETALVKAPWRSFFKLRTALTLIAWLVAIVYVHHYVHMFQTDLGHLLSTPLLQVSTAIIGLTALFYLIILSLPFSHAPGWRGITIMLIWAVLVVLGHALTHLGVENAQSLMNEAQNAIGPLGMLLFVAVYAVALAMPFVAGVEIGFLLIAVFGVKGVIIAYAGTLVGLSLAFFAGRFLSPRMLDAVLRKLGASENSGTLDEAMNRVLRGGRHDILGKLGMLMLRYRCLTLAILLNCPANAVIGGGGGIALLGGISRDISYTRFFLTIALAVAPFPILVLLGLMNVAPMLHHYGVLHDLLTALKQFLP